MILGLFVWYVNRIVAMTKFDQEILAPLQNYATKESDGLIYVYQVDSGRLWSSEIRCNELFQSRIELKWKILFNHDIVLGAEKGTIYIYRNESWFWMSIVFILGILIFGIKILLLKKGGEEEDFLISESFKNRMKHISKTLAINRQRFKDGRKNASKTLATNLARNSIVRKMATYKQKFKK